MTMKEAILTVLRDARKPMRPIEIADAIIARDLFKIDTGMASGYDRWSRVGPELTRLRRLGKVRHLSRGQWEAAAE